MYEMEIHVISGGPHESNSSWAEMERFVTSLRHKDEAICSIAAEVNHMKLHRIMVEEITFGHRDYVGTNYPHTDALEITARIRLMKAHHILIDNESSVSLFFKS